MPHHEQVKYSGIVADVFAHRFVLETAEGKFLADLGPKGAELFPLRKGAAVRVEGEQKPSEIKVHKICPEGGSAVTIEHPPKPHEHAFVDPIVALRAAQQAGFEVIGEAQRKPKHFEVRAQNAKGQLVELHIELDGHIRKEKPLARA